MLTGEAGVGQVFGRGAAANGDVEAGRRVAADALAFQTFIGGDNRLLQVFGKRRVENQVPFVRENPVLGSQVNVTGTVNVFEAAKRLGLQTPIAYASSAAVYDRNGNIAPGTLYGVFKLANEGTAAVYAAEHGLGSVGLRPFTVYGPGRDQGMTAGPTLAIEAAVRGEPYRIAFGGATQLHYAGDVARAFIQAGRSTPSGAETYCIGGPATSIADFVALVGTVVPGTEISHEDTVLPFPDQLPEPWFDSLLTPLEQGVRETAGILRGVI